MMVPMPGFLHLYFPRTSHEALHAASVLPESCWNEWGEVSMEERRIRVSQHLISEEGECEDPHVCSQEGFFLRYCYYCFDCGTCFFYMQVSSSHTCCPLKEYFANVM